MGGEKNLSFFLCRSIQAESNPIAWTNLGILYMLLGHAELANRAFKESQNTDPSYLRGWVGQALLAEQSGFKTEAMDLFRHTTAIGNEVESSLGYAHWVCRSLKALSSAGESNARTLYCLENMFGVTVALDCLARYTERVQGDPCALNMFGVLLERENLLHSAKVALEKALSAAVSEKERCERVGFLEHFRSPEEKALQEEQSRVFKKKHFTTTMRA